MNEFIEWVTGIMTKSVTIAPSCDQKDTEDDLVAANRSTGQPEAIAHDSDRLLMDDYDDYEYADHTKAAGWLRAHGYDEVEE